ncbi:MAG: pilus assembly protein [Marinobacter sp.]|nr:pilus assembly protein [Marinobacter sp.]
MKQSRGAVALEFLLLFPLVVAMLYAATTYGVLFFGKYQMQSVAEQAASSALRLDRNQFAAGELSGQVITTANATLQQNWAATPERLRAGTELLDCSVSEAGGISFLRCAISRNNEQAPMVPQMNFGFLGAFPPMPASMSVEASMAF